MAHGWTDRRFRSTEGGLRLGVVYGIAIVAVIVLSLVVWAISSKMEAEAYNRVTGENVSTWDAMWIELRVQSPPKKEEAPRTDLDRK